jgi:hypothetical protein
MIKGRGNKKQCCTSITIIIEGKGKDPVEQKILTIITTYELRSKMYQSTRLISRLVSLIVSDVVNIIARET